MTHDANHQLFSIAFAFAESELRDSWEWFLANLYMSLGEPNNLTIISDRQKGLIPSLQAITHSAHHCFCCHHIKENIKAAFNDGILRKFWKVALAYRPYEYDVYMNDILSVDQRAYNYIDTIRHQNWVTAFVHGRRYDMLTSNTVWRTNSLLKNTRVLPITKQVEEIHAKLMKFFERWHAQTQKITLCLTPYAEKYLSKEMEESCRLHVRLAGLVEFQVQSGEYIDVVNLECRSCSCHIWEVMGIPCSHAMAAIKFWNIDPYDYCEHWYQTPMYQMTYSEVLHATHDRKQWESCSYECVFLLLASKQPGWPKKNTVRVEDRNHVKRVVTYYNCKEQIHNRGTCRNPLAV